MTAFGNKPVGTLCDLDYLQAKLGRNWETVLRLIALCIENQPVLTERMNAAVQAGDEAALQETLHDIRNSYLLFSATQCVDETRKFESLLSDPGARSVFDQKDWQLLADALTRCMEAVSAELAVHLQQDDRPSP